ncbi:MAG: hypothetical protein JOY82_13830 [Streptosporangiaceae bacterium]|nr:hypothetical protein [Streptosporangiaceae bacterium]MBV9855571.1 hypothetical protein [Streptosporangiaceae bacterium]
MSDTSEMRAVYDAQARPPGQGQGHDQGQGQLVSRIGAVEIDWPRSLGFFGGIAVAVGAGLIEPPLGVFIAAVPFLKMLDLPRLPSRVRFVAQVFEGVAKPVGGDSEGTVRIVTAKGSSDEPVGGDS